MSGTFQLESEGVLSVDVNFYHADGTVSHYKEDFSPTAMIIKLKEDMVKKLGLSAEQQIWTCNGVKLLDDQTLYKAEVDPDDIIEITIR